MNDINVIDHPFKQKMMLEIGGEYAGFERDTTYYRKRAGAGGSAALSVRSVQQPVDALAGWARGARRFPRSAPDVWNGSDE
jgi:hypothetical protein